MTTTQSSPPQTTDAQSAPAESRSKKFSLNAQAVAAIIVAVAMLISALAALWPSNARREEPDGRTSSGPCTPRSKPTVKVVLGARPGTRELQVTCFKPKSMVHLRLRGPNGGLVNLRRWAKRYVGSNGNLTIGAESTFWKGRDRKPSGRYKFIVVGKGFHGNRRTASEVFYVR